MTGTVQRIIKDKKFGFIRGADRKDYFFHASALKNAQFDQLEQGQEVTFEETESDKGLRAEDVYV